MKYGCLKSQYNKSDPNPINHFSVAGANLKQTEKFSKTPSRHPTRTLRGSQSGAPELQRACESIREVARSYNPLLPPSWPPPPTADPNAPSTCQRRSTCPMLDKASYSHVMVACFLVNACFLCCKLLHTNDILILFIVKLCFFIF